jgi:hypothetical protein
MRNKLILILLFTISFLSSCKDKWKETAELKLAFNATQTQVNPNFKVTQAFFRPVAFNWYGQRKQSDNVTIAKSFTTNAKIDLLNGQFNEAPTIEIPQGTYTDINSSINFKGNSNNTIEINAEYIIEIDNEDETVIINIQFNTEEIAKLAGIDAPFDIVSENSYTLNFNVDFGYLLSGLNENMIENAEIEDENLVINANKNQAIYSYLLGRINNAMSLKMK